MAATGFRILTRTQSHKLLSSPAKVYVCRTPLVQQARFKTVTETGAYLGQPVQVRFGLIKIALTVTPFLLTGALISREFAAWLEEHELFVPEDDDDD